jgi:hypothetical protein
VVAITRKLHLGPGTAPPFGWKEVPGSGAGGVREVSAGCPRAVRGVDTFAPAPPHSCADLGGLRASTPLSLRVIGVESLGPTWFLLLGRGGRSGGQAGAAGWGGGLGRYRDLAGVG